MITAEELARFAGVQASADSFEAEQLIRITNAVNAWVSAQVPGARRTDVPWPDYVTWGALTLAHRLFARRASPTGVVTFSDMGGGAYISRWDPDLERMFGIGAWAKPVVA